MQNKRPLMKLSPDEELFLRHWMYDETHYKDGIGRAKELQLRPNAIPADLGTLIAATMPDPRAQKPAGLGPPPAPLPTWPWPTEEALQSRVMEARSTLLGQDYDNSPCG